MAQALATKYRPTTLEEVCGQESVLKILKRQVELRDFKNNYLFCGGSGIGKTTIARAFANLINKGCGIPIEIDAASNSGVDNVRDIIKAAQERSIDSEYKIFIIDECHALSNSAWQAFLKCIEEPPQYTIFIFCTTDPQKIPATILNRVMRFNFTRINTATIKSRLIYICQQEGFTNYEETVEYISKICDGGMRTAISMLDKVASYSTNIDIKNALEALGNYSYDLFFRLVNAIIDGNVETILKAVNYYYNQGNDLKLFVDQFLSFCLDISKYCYFHNCDMLKIPAIMEDKLKMSTNFENAGKYYTYIVDHLLELKNMLKTDSNPRSTIEVMLVRISTFK